MGKFKIHLKLQGLELDIEGDQYIQPHIMDYRGIITELLHKAGLRT